MHPQPSRRQRVAPLIELRVRKWLAKPKPLRHSARLRSGELRRGSLRPHWGEGGGWWRRPVTLRFEPACRAGASLFCHAPIWQAVWVLPPARGVLETPLHRWCPACLRSGAVAGNRTRTCVMAGRHSAVKSQPHSTPSRSPATRAGRRLEIQRAGSVIALPARAISTKNKHLLVIYPIPTRGFTAALSVFWAHLLRSP